MERRPGSGGRPARRRARCGLLALACVNAGRLGRQIPPFGGLDVKLSTNPVAFCAPRPGHDPILVDMTTSVVAEGKIHVACLSLMVEILGGLHSSRVDPAVGRIQLPGQPEFERAADGRAHGIPVDDTTWTRICERARRLGLDPAPWEAMTV